MGTPRRTGLAAALFSRVRLRILAIIFGHPERQYQLSEIIRIARSGRGAVQRELGNLTQAGIVSVSLANGRKFYQANQQCPIFSELNSVIIKTEGLLGPLQEALGGLAPKIKIAFVYGSVAKGYDTAKSDIDLFIIGHEIGYGEIYSALQKTEKKLMRPINPTVMSWAEWKQKALAKNPFIHKIERQPKLFVLGTEDDFKKSRQSR